MSKYLEESYDSALKEIEQLKIKLARYEKALQQISTFAIVGTVVHGEAMKEIAEEALKE